MPRMDGFAVVEAVGADKMPAVIFVTAHDQYAIRAFEISAVDYLLKPVTEERFRIAFERARNRVRTAPSDESARQMATVLDAIAKPRRYLSRLAIRSGAPRFLYRLMKSSGSKRRRTTSACMPATRLICCTSR